MEWRSVVEEHSGPRREHGDEPVPHHPAEGREVEDAIARPDVAVELMFLEMLDQRATGAMDNALGHAGRAGRIQDVKRMVERQWLEGERRASMRSDERLPLGIADDRPLEGRQSAGDIGRLAAQVEGLPTVGVLAGGNQQGRLDLTETIKDPLDAEVGRARRPNGTNRCRRQNRHDRLRGVGQIGGDAIAPPHAGCAHRCGRRCHVGAELAPRDRPRRSALRARDDRRAIAVLAQAVRREIQRPPREESRAGHAVHVDGDPRSLVADDLGEVPHRVPELERPHDARLVELRVGAATAEPCEIGSRDPLGGRRP